MTERQRQGKSSVAPLSPLLLRNMGGRGGEGGFPTSAFIFDRIIWERTFCGVPSRFLLPLMVQEGGSNTLILYEKGLEGKVLCPCRSRRRRRGRGGEGVLHSFLFLEGEEQHPNAFFPEPSRV